MLEKVKRTSNRGLPPTAEVDAEAGLGGADPEQPKARRRRKPKKE